MARSLTQRQVIIFGGALSFLALILTLGATFLINRVSEETSDRLLGASAKAIAEKVGVENGAVTFEMPPSALGMLEDNARDNIYYSISLGGKVLSGYEDFPAILPSQLDEESGPDFRYAEYLDQRVRVATQIRSLPRLSAPVIVQVAETLDQRRELASFMLISLAFLEFVLIVTAVVITRPAVRWALKPLTQVQTEIKDRNDSERILQPLDLEPVPQELTGLVTAFNDLLLKEERSNEQTRRFTANASHQMRTPLAILRTHLDAISSKARADPQIAASFEDIIAAADRLQRLLTQLLALARAEEAAGSARFSDCDVNAVAIETCREFAPTALAAGLEIHFEASHQIEAPIPALLLKEILRNLFDNAAKYHEIGDHILVTARLEESPVLMVEDNGRGIPADLVEQATDRFSRLERDSQKPGSGLGLPIVKAICASVGATFELKSEEGPRRLVAKIGFPLGRAAQLDSDGEEQLTRPGLGETAKAS